MESPMTVRDLELKSVRYRKKVLEIVARAGAGHTGGDLSCVDILNVLYNRIMKVSPANFRDPDRDRYIQSKGHSVEALYVVLAERGFFPEDDLKTLCRCGSHYVGHPTRKVNGIEQNTGALGHGLPVAVGLALAAKRDGRPYRVFTLLGDGELDEGSNWEASMAAVHYGLDNLVAIVDRNNLQITGDTEEVCPLEPLADKFRAFGYSVREVDGHDCAAMIDLLDQVPFEAGWPSLVMAKTVKGKGVSFIEGVAKWHHGVPKGEQLAIAIRELDEEEARLGSEPTPVATPAATPAAKSAKAAEETDAGLSLGKPNQQVFSETLLELAKADRDIVIVTSDSRGSGKLGPFAEALPDQIVEVGVAEQNLVGIAAGLASCGKKAFAVSPACFLTARAFEQIKNDVAYSDNPVKLIGISAGVSYGALGSTHHSIHDLAALRAISNIDIVAPADNLETGETLRAAVDYPRPLYVRLGKRPTYDLHAAGTKFEVGRAITVREGTDLTFVATGETVFFACAAAEKLKTEGVGCRVLSMHTLRPLDTEAILRAASETGAVITVEEHSVHGGLGEACAAVLMEGGARVPFRLMGIADEYTATGSQVEILSHYGISGRGLAEAARRLLKRA
jgi:transketolase